MDALSVKLQFQLSSVYCGAETPAFRPGEERRLDYSRVVSSPQNLDKQEFRRFCQQIAWQVKLLVY